MSDRGNKLKDFNGTRSKYREWIYECHMYILANPTKYDTDKDKTLMVLSYMREGTASLFAQKYYFDRELREYKATETRKTWGTFKDFLKELAAAFKDESLEQKVRQKLFTMRMGKRSADEFVTDYLMMAGESGFNLESTVDYFRHAIHPEILKQIYRLPDMPTTMDDWVKYTRRFNNQWRELQSIKSSVPSAAVRSSNPFRYNSSNAPSSMNNSVVPMAVDSVRTTLTDKERNRLRMKGGCFYYRQKGHMANQCPVRGSSRIHEGSARYVQQSSGMVGTARLRPAAGWEAEEAAMAKRSRQELQAVLREALRRKVEAWRRLTRSEPDSQLAKLTHPDRMRLYVRRSLRLAEKRSKGSLGR
ncbi:hypothetical protein HETIRDRAFT_428593 [Heterobasidion irregulare TC 32-1]|uniref:Retrotransposon gag domain-containing protein n=1 Tax=Heterobasidion irregulare (strain TC 32-1) TaxID=747525 RepID=W4JZ58_HETIT|nr:uncharacterized protein HETIRDRAFT_428593 [Heterobasidion irregulare TC 32-1]ETW78759.1 hypothetical protein HETIRDRAFT_428593 [Heterobasidion irregulare TC 32-1]